MGFSYQAIQVTLSNNNEAGCPIHATPPHEWDPRSGAWLDGIPLDALLQGLPDELVNLQ
jgi:hypothetical protein